MHSLYLTEAVFWIRLHDLPLMGINETVGRMVGGACGKVIEVDLSNGEVEWGEFMRIHVCVDVYKPLLRGKKILLGLNGPYWIRFSYERLPDFCYICSKIGHAYRDCEQWGNSTKQGVNKDGQTITGAVIGEFTEGLITESTAVVTDELSFAKMKRG
ncbi:hypothetical protein F2P56_007345 [Juglans regia]|uniref:CCHC-type domain-containing protein n=1 Tax=Juglans regia TaxID=51240 RepID=A0A833XR82_JUGRE|nr:hypothetical protein F2P56_007345 [Juglans regia]